MNYLEFKEAVIAEAEAGNIQEYELYYEQSEGIGVSVFKTELKEYSTTNQMGVCFRCIVDGKLGYASTEDMTQAEAVSIVKRAVENARSIESEEQVFIHGAGDSYDRYEEPEKKEPSGEELIGFATNLQKELYAQDSRVKDGTESAAGYLKRSCALYNSKGLDLSEKSEYGYTGAYPIVSEGEEMYDGSDNAAGDFFAFDEKEIAKKAVEDAVSSIGYTSVESGKYDTVISSQVMSTFLAAFGDVFSAESAQKGMSLLKGKEGEAVAADTVTITDDPLCEKALVKKTFDAEGVATRKKNVVENGKLVTLLHNLKTAALDKAASTGNAFKASYASSVGIGFYSFYINPVKGSTEELMAQVGDGIYLTEITGLHAGANVVTGDFSLSSSGFLIKDGKKGKPIRNFTVSGNFYELLKSITVVGGDLEFNKHAFGVSRTGSPDVIVPQVMVAGKKQE